MVGRQSPVDIPPTAPIHRQGLEFRYGSIPLVRGENPWAIQIDNVGHAGVVIDGRPHPLVQLHLHCPGEHTLAGKRAAMELHLVHGSSEAGLVVVGVMFEMGPENPALEAIVAMLRDDAPEAIDLASLVPDDRAHVAYDGSLTTPPYTEGVAWRVLVRSRTLSPGQLATLRAAHADNARPVQPMGDRGFA